MKIKYLNKYSILSNEQSHVQHDEERNSLTIDTVLIQIVYKIN